MLTIEPEGGIRNRLQVIYSAIALSQAIGQPLRLVWVANKNLGCALPDFLKVPVEVATVVNFSKLDWSKRRKLQYNLQRYARFDYLRPNFRGADIEAMVNSGFDFTGAWKAASNPHQMLVGILSSG